MLVPGRNQNCRAKHFVIPVSPGFSAHPNFIIRNPTFVIDEKKRRKKLSNTIFRVLKKLLNWVELVSGPIIGSEYRIIRNLIGYWIGFWSNWFFYLVTSMKTSVNGLTELNRFEEIRNLKVGMYVQDVKYPVSFFSCSIGHSQSWMNPKKKKRLKL